MPDLFACPVLRQHGNPPDLRDPDPGSGAGTPAPDGPPVQWRNRSGYLLPAAETHIIAGADLTTFSNRKLLPLLLITGVAMVAGAALRLHNIGNRTMSHVEMFVPGIPLPADLAVPPPRLDVSTVVSKTLSDDTHPPGYYLLMLFVTKLFGSGTLAIRLPSVLFGVATIGLVFWLGILTGQPVPGCIAAIFLALNGYHIVWSQTGRMYAMICFLGLAATIQLLLLARSMRPSGMLEIGYAATMLLGLSSHVFFWAILATHLTWVLVNACIRDQPMPRLLGIQILIMIAGSPLLAVAAYQSGNQVAFLSRDVPQIARQFIQFVYLIPGWDDTYAPAGKQALALAPQFAVPLAIFFLLCLLFLALGIRRLEASREQTLVQPEGRVSSFTTAWLLAAGLAAGSLLMYIVYELHHTQRHKPTLKYMEAMTVLPFVMAFAATALQKFWGSLRSLRPRPSLEFLEGGSPLVLMMAFIPFLLLSAVSVLFRPLMDPRGLVYLSPYMLLILACGVATIAQRSTLIAVPLFVVLGALHGFSAASYRDRTVSPVDFRDFAEKLTPRVWPADIIFFRKDWDTTPILYYLKTDRYHLVGTNFAYANRTPAPRIWVLLFRGESFPRSMKQALDHYHEGEKVEVYLASAVLYCRDSCQ